MRTQRVNPTASTRPLPRGNHGLERSVVLLSQRARLTEGVVLAVAEKGYVATRVQDITKHARVSRTTFYEQFADKEECFLEAYRDGSELQFNHIADAVRRAPDPTEAAIEGVRANLKGLAARPAHAWAFLIEVHAAGPALRAAREEVHERYAGLLAEQAWARAADAAELPQEIFRAAVAAADEVVVGYLREGKGERLLELAPTVVYIHLALAGLPALTIKPLEAPLVRDESAGIAPSPPVTRRR